MRGAVGLHGRPSVASQLPKQTNISQAPGAGNDDGHRWLCARCEDCNGARCTCRCSETRTAALRRAAARTGWRRAPAATTAAAAAPARGMLHSAARLRFAGAAFPGCLHSDHLSTPCGSGGAIGRGELQRPRALAALRRRGVVEGCSAAAQNHSAAAFLSAAAGQCLHLPCCQGRGGQRAHQRHGECGGGGGAGGPL
jgi:hypothetical protein